MVEIVNGFILGATFLAGYMLGSVVAQNKKDEKDN